MKTKTISLPRWGLPLNTRGRVLEGGENIKVMEKKIISFKGISNVPDDGLNEAGDMSVLLNMRHKGGELVPSKKPSVYKWSTGIKQLLYHEQSGYWLAINSEGALGVYDFTKESPYITLLISPSNGMVANKFSLFGNIVIINFTENSEEKVYYCIWRNGRYEYLGGLPEVPEMKIKLSHHLKSVTSEGGYSYSKHNNETSWMKHSKGFFDKALDGIYKSKYFVDNVLFIVGIKLFDGSYRYSHLYYVRGEGEFVLDGLTVSSGIKNFATYIGTAINDNEKANITAEVVGFHTDLSFDYNLGKWEDIISSVDIFTSGSIMEHEVKTGTLDLFKLTGYGTLETVSSEVTLYTNKAVPQLRNEIESCSIFSKFASYDLKGNLLWEAEETSPSYLSVQDKLPATNLKQFISKKNLVYNTRLHLYEYREVKNLATKNMLDGDYSDGKDFELRKSIEMKTNVLFKDGTLEKTTYDYTQTGIAMNCLSCLISHPSRDVAKTQSVYTEKDVTKFISTELKNHSLMDMSLCLIGKTERAYRVRYNIIGGFNNAYDSNSSSTYNTEFNPVVFLDKIGNTPKSNYELFAPWNDGVHDWWTLTSRDGNFEIIEARDISQYGVSGNVYPGTRINITIEKAKCKYDITPIEETTGEEVLTGHEDEEIKSNILKVSAVDNPFYFPTAQTYKFEGDIVGLASNAEAISTGQFGQFPLFVFTQEGIWAMQVDTSGKGAYLSQAPFSREVCNGAICPVSGGVVFTTKRGVMAISGGQVTELSKPLDGLEEMLFNFSGALAGQIFARAGYSDYKKFEPVPIREYINGAKLAYNYLHNELILCNTNYGYSYVYNFDSQKWSMTDIVFDLVTNKYPELVVYENNTAKVCTFDDTTTGVVPVVAITRPFTLGSFDFKRLRQAGLRTTFEGQLNFYLLGSNDGAEFKCITGKEVDANKLVDSGTYRDLITAMSRSKQYKYFAIAIAGDIEGRISMAELLVDMGFANNKIR